jgi:3-hydroxymyristoyl/3-hydroxydecanoyl-(acyl carrier protein) dehydratase
MKWYSLEKIDSPSSHEIIMYTKVLPDSPWFSGHFPGDPILPGIAQLEMALDGIKRLTQKNVKISFCKKIRFKKLIRPNDKITIKVALREGDVLSYSFRIAVDEEMACNGILTVEVP